MGFDSSLSRLKMTFNKPAWGGQKSSRRGERLPVGGQGFRMG